MTADSLSEPHVLARTKRRLFPDDDDGYVVADTQFAQERWLDDRPIDETVRSSLAPFNHVQVGTGYPDLVGVDAIDDELLAANRQGGEPPLIVVEAKGHTAGGGVDIERAIVQAHDRLNEANVAFVAAPTGAITTGARTLARELNVGVLGVGVDGDVTALERPRVVGNRTTDEATAIRFQASAQGVTDRSFGLNHPKNYLAVPLAIAHSEPTRDVLAERVVRAVNDAIRGAVFLGLVENDRDQPRLTELGREVVRFAQGREGVDAALDQFDGWKRSRARFVDLAPAWGQLTRRIVFEYPATRLVVTELQTLYEDGHPTPSLVEFVEYLHAVHPTFTVELFLRGDEQVRERALTAEGRLRTDVLRDGNAYHAPTVFQLKAIYYHAGILTSRGAEPSNLDPEADIWALREPVEE